MEQNMTALVSLFARAYHQKNKDIKIFDDLLSTKLITEKEYEMIGLNMSQGISFFNPTFKGSKEEALKWIVDHQLSPSVLVRSAFCKEAFEEMKSGIPVKLPSWAGYWWWDEESQTILMYTKDGDCLDIRETQNVEYTLQNILSDEWVYADSRNCPILGGEATFSFGEAIKYLKRGMKVARKGWNGKKQYIQLASGISYKSPTGDIVNCEHDAIGNMAVAFVGTSGVQMGWLASQADMLAEDWVFA